MIRRDDVRDLSVLLGQFVRPYWPLLGVSTLLGLVVAAVATLQPLALAPALDVPGLERVAPAASWSEVSLNNVGPTLLAWTGLGGSAWWVLALAVTAYVLLVTVSTVGAFANMLLASRIRTLLFRDLQMAVYRNVLGLSMGYFVRQRTGELGSRLVNDAFDVSQTVDMMLRPFLQAVAQLLFCALLLLKTDARLTIVVVVVFAAHLVITRVLRERIRAMVTDQFNLYAEISSRVQETMLSIRIVKCFAAERFEIERFLASARRLSRVLLKGAVFKYVGDPVRDITNAVALGVVLFVAFGALAEGRLTVAGLVLFVMLVRQAFVPIGQIAAALLSLQAILGSGRRLLEILRERPAVASGTREPAPLNDAIRLEQVSFAYEPGREVVKRVSFEIRRGEMVALIGPSGAGKSTVADLIMRLYDPTEGRVTWDGVDVREFRQEEYRRRLGVVSQEALLFNATVAENIAYGRRIEPAAVVAAARAAHADGFIAALAQGYDTQVGDRGIRLSGGQRQRIATARAIYGRPDVLILDEATSALDSESEMQVQAAIDDLAGHVTLLVIAHRLSTVIRADRIVLLDEGRVQAIGSHEELLRSAPSYRRLCEAQFGTGTVVGVPDVAPTGG